MVNFVIALNICYYLIKVLFFDQEKKRLKKISIQFNVQFELALLNSFAPEYGLQSRDSELLFKMQKSNSESWNFISVLGVLLKKDSF